MDFDKPVELFSVKPQKSTKKTTLICAICVMVGVSMLFGLRSFFNSKAAAAEKEAEEYLKREEARQKGGLGDESNDKIIFPKLTGSLRPSKILDSDCEEDEPRSDILSEPQFNAFPDREIKDILNGKPQLDRSSVELSEKPKNALELLSEKLKNQTEKVNVLVTANDEALLNEALEFAQKTTTYSYDSESRFLITDIFCKISGFYTYHVIKPWELLVMENLYKTEKGAGYTKIPLETFNRLKQSPFGINLLISQANYVLDKLFNVTFALSQYKSDDKLIHNLILKFIFKEQLDKIDDSFILKIEKSLNLSKSLTFMQERKQITTETFLAFWDTSTVTRAREILKLLTLSAQSSKALVRSKLTKILSSSMPLIVEMLKIETFRPEFPDIYSDLSESDSQLRSKFDNCEKLYEPLIGLLLAWKQIPKELFEKAEMIELFSTLESRNLKHQMENSGSFIKKLLFKKGACDTALELVQNEIEKIIGLDIEVQEVELEVKRLQVLLGWSDKLKPEIVDAANKRIRAMKLKGTEGIKDTETKRIEGAVELTALAAPVSFLTEIGIAEKTGWIAKHYKTSDVTKLDNLPKENSDTAFKKTPESADEKLGDANYSNDIGQHQKTNWIYVKKRAEAEKAELEAGKRELQQKDM